jgi:hypothetical protein
MTNAFVLITMKSALKLLNKGIQPNRAYTSKNVLATVGKQLGKKYPNSQTGRDQAILDIEEKLK